VTGWQRLRSVVNWINLMTPCGLAVARIGGGRPRRGPDGLWITPGYRLGFPIARAFTIGNVVTTKFDADFLLAAGNEKLLEHEVRHTVQYSILGPLFLPLYGVALGYSWIVSGDHGGRNVFERWAGLADGGYVRAPLRPGLARTLDRAARRRVASPPCPSPPAPPPPA
jgi:hypothetical protein